MLETVEGRTLPAINVIFKPVGDFFTNNPAALKILQAAAAQITSRIENNLAEIPAGYNWTAWYTDPVSEKRVTLSKVGIPANTLIIYVGGRPMTDTLATTFDQYSGGPANGIYDQGAGKIARNRGQSQYSTWGGSIAFASNRNWSFVMPSTKPAVGTYDFYSVALHEMGHILGFTTSNNDPKVLPYKSGTFWTGPEVVKAFDNKSPKLDRMRGLHWDAYVRSHGLKPAMSGNGEPAGPGFYHIRKFTPLDFAALRDLGWKVSVSSSNELQQQARFSGAMQTDRVVWRPGGGTWYVAASANLSQTVQQWGLPADIPVNGDFNGDGRTDFGVFRPSNGTWYIRQLSGATTTTTWGLPGDIPVPGDYDGDGRSDLAVYRPSNRTWYVVGSTAGAYTQPWGEAGDLPVPADYDGDGTTDVAIWRPRDGSWYIVGSTAGIVVQPTWGQRGDVPVPGDYDGDGKADFAVWRPSTGTWWVLRTSDRAAFSKQWGLPGDVPQPADFDGDGLVDFVVWRPNEGNWYVFKSSVNSFEVQQWGLPGDIPAANAQAALLARLA